MRWSQWLTPDSIILQYSKAGEPKYKTVKYGTTSGVSSELSFAANDQNYIETYPSCWRVSPGRTLVLGYSAGHAIFDIEGDKRSAIPMVSLEARWSGASSFIETEVKFARDDPYSPISHITKTIVDPVIGTVKAVEHSQVPGNLLALGATSNGDTVLCANVFSDWVDSASVIVESPAGSSRASSGWTFRPPGLYSILDVVVSPDGKELCWLTLSARKAASEGRRGSAARVDGAWADLDAEVWVSTVNGLSVRRISAFELPGVYIMTYQLHHQHRREMVPIGLEWLPGSKAVSYIWDGRVWTVPVE